MLSGWVALMLVGPPAACNDRQVWDAHLVAEVKAGVAETLGVLDAAGVKLDAKQLKAVKGKLFSKLLWRIVRSHIIGGDHNNAAALPLTGVKTGDGKSVTLYRSGFTPKPEAEGSCVRALVAGGVRHVLNLYAGPMQTDDLEAAERTVVEAAGGTYFAARTAGHELSEWRELLRKKGEVKHAQAAVARIINEYVLRPGGKPPRGDIHVHCGGGMHRTGMVVGVIDRCLNGAAEAKIVADYRKHVAWRSDQVKGGYEEDNVAFIKAFDCALLKR